MTAASPSRSFTLIGFLGLSGGDVPYAAPGTTRFAYYNVYVRSSAGALMPGRFRIYCPSGVAAPDNTIWYGLCRVQAPSAHVEPGNSFQLEAAGVGAYVPGHPDDEVYGDALPEIDAPFANVLGHIVSPLSDIIMDDGQNRTGFRVATSEYLNNAIQSSVVV